MKFDFSIFDFLISLSNSPLRKARCVMLYFYNMNRIELQFRTKKFNIDIIHFCNSLPKTAAGFEIAKQLIRSAGSVGANYRATNRSKSEADFAYKLKIVLEEIDESYYLVRNYKRKSIKFR